MDLQDGDGKQPVCGLQYLANKVFRLFLLEGLFTSFVGVASWVLMPPSITQTRGRGRGKGYFDEREEKILVNRLLRDDPSKGDMHNRQAVGPVRLWKSLKDFDLWPVYLLGLTTYIPPNPPQVSPQPLGKVHCTNYYRTI